MSKVDEERTHQARRAAIGKVLTESGMDHGVAARWCNAWEAEAALQGFARDTDFWDAGKLWIDAQCAARERPPA